MSVRTLKKKALLYKERCILGVFAKLRKATISFVLSARPHGTTLIPLDGFLWNLVSEYFSKLCLENSSFNTIWQNNGYFTWRPIYIFLSYLAQFFLEWEMFQTNVVEKIETHFMINNLFFSKIVPVIRCGKKKILYSPAGHTSNYNMAPAHRMPDT